MKSRKNHYDKFDCNDMILRDHLATDRTILANERTLLAYIRTCLTFLAAGVTVIKLLDTDKLFLYLGWSLIIIGIMILVRGLISYKTMHEDFKKFRV